MIRLYEGSGSREIHLLDIHFSDPEWARLKNVVVKILNRRGNTKAAELLQKYPFVVHEGTNGFCDEFSVLYMRAPMDVYIELAELAEDPSYRHIFGVIAHAVNEIGPYIRFIAVDLDTNEQIEPVAPPSLEITSDVVERALREAEKLLSSEGATSGVDRIHTAFHGYLRAVAAHANISAQENAGVTELFKVIRDQHPSLHQTRTRQSDIDKVIRSLANIIDVLNPVRNHASIAHPNEKLLEDPEAMLVINGVKTLLHYLNARLKI